MALALGAGAQTFLAREVDRLAVAFGQFGRVAEIELQLPVADLAVVGELDLGREGPARLAAKAFQRADLLVAHQRFGLGGFEGAAGGDLGHRKAAAFFQPAGAGAGEAAVVLLDHAAAVRARHGQRGVVAGDGVAVVFLGLAHDALGHLGDLGHEGVAAEPAMLHLGELVLPVAGEVGPGQVFDRQPAQQRHQLEGLGRGHEVAAVAQHVLLGDQAFDGLRARGRRAQALFLHRVAQVFVLDQLARAFHRREQRGLGVARRRLGPQRVDVHALGAHLLSRRYGHQIGVVVLRLLAVDGQPAGAVQHLAVGLEVVFLARGGDLADARGDHELGAGIEHRQEALDDHVVELELDLGQRLRCLQRGDDGKVVRHLGVVEDALDGLDVALFQTLLRVRAQLAQRPRQVFVRQHGEGLFHRGQVVLGQRAAVGTRVGQHLVLFVQRLRQAERGLGGKTEARIGLALQRRQVVEQG